MIMIVKILILMKILMTIIITIIMIIDYSGYSIYIYTSSNCTLVPVGTLAFKMTTVLSPVKVFTQKKNQLHDAPRSLDHFLPFRLPSWLFAVPWMWISMPTRPANHVLQSTLPDMSRIHYKLMVYFDVVCTFQENKCPTSLPRPSNLSFQIFDLLLCSVATVKAFRSINTQLSD